MDKNGQVAELREEFAAWETLLSQLDPSQSTHQPAPGEMSMAETVGHLHAWLQRTVARTEAALNDTTPNLPNWPANLDPESDDDLEAINAWITETFTTRPWPEIYQEWHTSTQRLLAAAEALPEATMFDTSRFPWMSGYSIGDVLQGSLEHHNEHRMELP